MSDERLIREGNPPEGLLASPLPQHRKKDAPPKVNSEYETVRGQNGAPFSQLVDVNGNPLTPVSKQDIDALRNDVAKDFFPRNLAFGVLDTSNTAVEIKTDTDPLPNRVGVRLFAEGDAVIYIGSELDQSNGYPLLPGREIELTFHPSSSVQLYAWSEAPQKLRVIEEVI